MTLANDMQHITRGGGSKAFPAGKCWEITTVQRDNGAAVRTTWVATWLLAQQWTTDWGYNSNNGYVVTVRPLRWEPFAGWVSAGPVERI